jgi:hypothetical protein
VSLLFLWLALASACQRQVPTIDWSRADAPPDHFKYTADARVPCWLKLNREVRPVIRVNCFAADGILYTHSNRFVPLARLAGRSWTTSVEHDNRIQIALEDRVYAVVATMISDERQRVRMLKARGYSYVPDAIQVYALVMDQ